MGAPAGQYTVEVVRQLQSTDTLTVDVTAKWRELPQTEREFTQSVEWMLTAAETLYPAGTLRLFHLKRQDELVALAPFASTRNAWPERLEFAGATTLFEPCGCNYRDESALQELCNVLVRAGRPIVLQRIDAEGPLLHTFKSAARRRGQLLQFKASGAPFVPIATTWDEYFQSLSSRRRQDYRRARRGLEKEGKVTIDIQSPEEASVDALMAEAMRVEAASWKGREGSAMLKNPRLNGFFLQLTRRLARQGKLRLCFLRLNDEAIAMQVAAVHGGRWWVLKIGYDERWAEHSPGIQLMWEALREAFEQRLTSFEMLGSAEPWLNIWTRTERAYRTLAFYPYNGRGMVALAADIMRAFVQRLRARSSGK